MKRILVLMMVSGLAYAQQQVTPQDFDAQQARLFHKITEAVSAPCCKNGIPVAYHDSGMAQQIRNIIADQIRDGEREKMIMTRLSDMRFGPNKDLEIIFTVPGKNWLGYVFWWIGALLVIMLSWAMVMMLRRKAKPIEGESDEALIARYRDYIEARLAG